MSPALRTAIYTAACACDEAGIPVIVHHLQTLADAEGTDDRAGRSALNAASLVALAVWSERRGSGSRYAAECASHAADVCRDLAAASLAAEMGMHCEHCSNDGECSVCGRAA